MKDYEYQAYVCNNILYTALLNLKASGVPAEDIKVMLDCIGKALVTMSIEDKPIDYYMKNVEAFMTGNRRCDLSNDEIAALFEKLPKQGKWIKIFENPFTNGYVCSCCGHKIQVTEQFLPEVTECEGCGAEMKVEGE